MTLVLLQMEGDTLLGTQRDTQSLTSAIQDTGSLEVLPELVSLMGYGQGVQLHAQVSTLLMRMLRYCNMYL